jgi:hypothetical protein
MVQLLQEYIRNGSPIGNLLTPVSHRRHAALEDGRAAELPTSPSIFTEPSYANGSFLPVRRSFLLKPMHPNLKPQRNEPHIYSLDLGD